jgi:hypothetical protein
LKYIVTERLFGDSVDLKAHERMRQNPQKKLEDRMTSDPVEDDRPAARQNEFDPESFLSAAKGLAAFAREHDLGRADALLRELLAVLYRRKT